MPLSVSVCVVWASDGGVISTAWDHDVRVVHDHRLLVIAGLVVVAPDRIAIARAGAAHLANRRFEIRRRGARRLLELGCRTPRPVLLGHPEHLAVAAAVLVVTDGDAVASASAGHAAERRVLATCDRGVARRQRDRNGPGPGPIRLSRDHRLRVFGTNPCYRSRNLPLTVPHVGARHTIEHGVIGASSRKRVVRSLSSVATSVGVAEALAPNTRKPRAARRTHRSHSALEHAADPPGHARKKREQRVQCARNGRHEDPWCSSQMGPLPRTRSTRCVVAPTASFPLQTSRSITVVDPERTRSSRA